MLDPGFEVINCVHFIAIIFSYVGSGFTRGILVSGVHVRMTRPASPMHIIMIIAELL